VAELDADAELWYPVVAFLALKATSLALTDTAAAPLAVT
jgi:hypothetical protein